MSFFHEPPPLDSDIPPPLDDKVRDSDFDLEEEDILTNNEWNLPELPTDFHSFSSLTTDENISELPEIVIPSSSPVSECDKNEITNCDVAKEKESLNDDEVASQMFFDQMARYDEKLEEVLSEEEKDNSVMKVPIELQETIDDNCSHDDILSKNNIKIDACLKNNKIDSDHDRKSPFPTNDEDFEDFVSCVETESKTENILESDTRFGEAGFKVCNDIPESFSKHKLDDDEFNDFETAIPINRLVQVNSDEVNKEAAQLGVQFEADFSAFNAFDETSDTLNFKKVESQSHNEYDDDDFGDFSDFTQAYAPVSCQQTSSVELVAFVKPANVNGILDMMFPSTSSCSDEKPEIAVSDYTKEQQVIKSDSFVNKLNDFDSTLALAYLYSNSKASRTLVKALGIDTRNILLGPQWASSSASSNMPRFAANMSLNPIEPTIRAQTLSVQSSTEQPKPSVLQPVKVKSETVPEAEFDWNSSGLVNPLDGPQPKPQQPHEPILVQQQPPAIENESSLYVVDQEVSQVFEAETKANASHKSELSDTLAIVAAYQWSNDVHQQQHHIASSNILVRERTIKLPETHIFTPVKGTSPVAREVVSRDVSPIPDDPYFPAKGSIVVKEYHDVEYSLEPKKKSDLDTDFDEFQSAQPTTTVVISKPEPHLLSLNLLEPQKVEITSKEIKWPEPGTNVQFSNELDFLETSATIVVPKVNFNQPPSNVTASLVVPKNKDSSVDYLKPVIGTSPTEQVDDDDFNDFQAAPSIKPAPKLVQSNDPITLSPARLVSQQTNQKSTWISAMDDDEITRIEAAFPKCKTEKKFTPKSNEEDDWSDFVAAQPTSLPYTQSQPPSMISSNNMGKFLNGDGDDWSDFVSVPIAKIPSAKSSGAISSQLQSKPNFSSWNQPMGKHQYVNHSTSFLTNEPPNQNFPYGTEKFARGSPVTITDNFNYNFNHSEIAMSSIMNHNHHYQRHEKKSNGISTILPELDFAMPKNLMNLPRGENLDSGKK